MLSLRYFACSLIQYYSQLSSFRRNDANIFVQSRPRHIITSRNFSHFVIWVIKQCFYLSHLLISQLRFTATITPSSAGSDEPNMSAFTDQTTLKLSEGSKNLKNGLTFEAICFDLI